MKRTFRGVLLMMVAAAVGASCAGLGGLSSGGADAGRDGGSRYATSSCGGGGEPCCSGTACNTGFACGQGVCLRCGSAGEPCCSGSICDDPLTCAAGFCGKSSGGTETGAGTGTGTGTGIGTGTGVGTGTGSGSSEIRDAGAPSDAHDASSDAVASPCAVSHTFCDDFDTPGEVLGGTAHGTNPSWDTSGSATAGPRVLSPVHVTPPYSFGVSVPSDVSNGARSELTKTVTASTELTVSFDLQVVLAASDGGVGELDVFDIVFPPSPDYGNGSHFYLTMDTGGPLYAQYFLGDGGSYGGAQVPFAVSFATFHHVVVTLSIPNQTVMITVDGVNVGSPRFAATIPAGAFTAAFGANYAYQVSRGASLNFDDVAIDVQ
jgi:hypothetical protein